MFFNVYHMTVADTEMRAQRSHTPLKWFTPIIATALFGIFPKKSPTVNVNFSSYVKFPIHFQHESFAHALKIDVDFFCKYQYTVHTRSPSYGIERDLQLHHKNSIKVKINECVKRGGEVVPALSSLTPYTLHLT